MTNRFLVSMSPCLGRLKSFFATSTPSVVTVCQPILVCSKLPLKHVYFAIAMARAGNILTAEEVPVGETVSASSIEKYCDEE